jgi:hypothetical protein
LCSESRFGSGGNGMSGLMLASVTRLFSAQCGRHCAVCRAALVKPVPRCASQTSQPSPVAGQPLVLRLLRLLQRAGPNLVHVPVCPATGLGAGPPKDSHGIC